MSGIRKSIFINESNQDILEWFEGVKSPSEAVFKLIREDKVKDREIALLKQVVQQQQQTIQLYESIIKGTNITITHQDTKEEREEVKPDKEEGTDMSLDSSDAVSILEGFNC